MCYFKGLFASESSCGIFVPKKLAKSNIQKYNDVMMGTLSMH